jgi:hypothetical protein
MSSVVSRPAFVLARVCAASVPVVISVLDAHQREARGQLVDVVVGRATAGTREQQGSGLPRCARGRRRGLCGGVTP